MNMPRSALSLGALTVGLVMLSGCGSTEPLYPVSGKVTFNGVPLSSGQVVFVPDSAKGNKVQASPAGKVGPDGVYTLQHGGEGGCPRGLVQDDGGHADLPAPRTRPRHPYAVWRLHEDGPRGGGHRRSPARR